MQVFLGELVFHPSPQTVEQAFVGRDEKRAPLKMPAWEAIPQGSQIQCILNNNSN